MIDSQMLLIDQSLELQMPHHCQLFLPHFSINFIKHSWVINHLEKPHWYGDKICWKCYCIWSYKHLLYTGSFLKFLYTGVTSANFNSKGKFDFWMQTVKLWYKHPGKYSEFCFGTIVGLSASFEVPALYKFFISFKISYLLEKKKSSHSAYFFSFSMTRWCFLYLLITLELGLSRSRCRSSVYIYIYIYIYI